jgi:hypothetical protein
VGSNPVNFVDPFGLFGLAAPPSPLRESSWLDFGIGAAIGGDANIGFDIVGGDPDTNVSAAVTFDIGQMFFVDAREASGLGDIQFDASTFINAGGFARGGHSMITSPTFHPEGNYVRGPIPLPGDPGSLGGYVGGGVNLFLSSTSDPTAFSDNLTRQGGFDIGLGPLGGLSVKVAGNTEGDTIVIISFGYGGFAMGRGWGLSWSEVPSTTWTPLRD